MVKFLLIAAGICEKDKVPTDPSSASTCPELNASAKVPLGSFRCHRTF